MRDAQIIRGLEEDEGNKYIRMLEAVDIKKKEVYFLSYVELLILTSVITSYSPGKQMISYQMIIQSFP